jgi:hypothetical protein
MNLWLSFVLFLNFVVCYKTYCVYEKNMLENKFQNKHNV